MGEGLKFATLATLVGKRNAALWGKLRVTIEAVGVKDGERFVMARDKLGCVLLGTVDDFQIAPSRKRVQ